MTTTDKKCPKIVTPYGMWHGNPCGNNPIRGSVYCGVHDPEQMKARRKKRGPTRNQLEWAVRRKQRELAEAAEKVVAYLEAEGPDGFMDKAQELATAYREIQNRDVKEFL